MTRQERAPAAGDDAARPRAIRDRTPDVERWTAFWRGRERPEEFYPPSIRILEHLLHHAPPRARVLEVGAGSGRDSAALARSGRRVFLLDSSAGALDLSARNDPALRGRSLVRGDALRAPFPDETFDLVFHQGLMEHFPDPAPLLVENRRLLRSGGILLVDVPQTFHPWTPLKKALIAIDRWFAGWETQFTPTTLERVVSAAGFELLATYGDWMNPSLAYRLVRQALGRAGVRLPMYPPKAPGLDRVRCRMRDALLRSRAALYTAHTVGVVAQKPVL